MSYRSVLPNALNFFLLLSLSVASTSNNSSSSNVYTQNTTSASSCDVNRDDIRFFGSGGDAGRVELCYESTWRYVCAQPEHWSLDTATVACRQLGYKSAFMANTAQKMAFQGDSGVNAADDGIFISNCRGNEPTLRDCQWDITHQCTKKEAIAAACSTAISDNAASTYPKEIQKQVETYMKDMQSWLSSEQTRQQQQQQNQLEVVGEEGECAANNDDGKNKFPTPFHDVAAIQEAFLFPDSVTKIYQEIESGFNNKSIIQILQQAEQLIDADGFFSTKVRWNALGMDFSNFFSQQQEEDEEPMSLDQVALQLQESPILRAARDLYLSANKHNAIHWYLDTPYRWYSSPSTKMLNEDPKAMKLFQTLQRDGIVLIEDFGADIDTIVNLAQKALTGDSLYRKNETSIAGGGSIVTSRKPIPQLEQLLIHNETLRAVINAYQGPSLLHGYKVTHLNMGLKTTDQYNAGMYHHDRVGRRIKLFLFLNDVDCEMGHPTRVAAGSQNLLYYKSEDYPVTRFRDDYVESNYNIVKGCGPRGGGFLFDTHTIHKGTVEGDRERTVVIAEYHHMAKCAYSKEYNLGIPCPGGDIYRTDAPLF